MSSNKAKFTQYKELKFLTDVLSILHYFAEYRLDEILFIQNGKVGAHEIGNTDHPPFTEIIDSKDSSTRYHRRGSIFWFDVIGFVEDINPAFSARWAIEWRRSDYDKTGRQLYWWNIRGLPPESNLPILISSSATYGTATPSIADVISKLETLKERIKQNNC